MSEPDLHIPPRFPSVVEIVGLGAAIVPFIVKVSSMSSSMVDGRVVSFEYRDNVALVCGAVAFACGVFAAFQIRRTPAAQRMLRGLLVAALLGLGVFQILRGLGKVGVDMPETSTAFTPPQMPSMPTPAAVDVDVDLPTRALFAAWRDGRIGEIYEAAHPELKKAVTLAEFEHVSDLFVRSFGTFQNIGATIEKRQQDGAYIAEGKAQYEKGTLDFVAEYQLVDGKPALINLKLNIPEPLRVEPDNAAADATARRFLDGLLAQKVEVDLLDPRLLANLGDFAPKLKDVIADIGKVKKISALTVTECKTRCLTAQVVGKKKATYTVELKPVIRTWEITAFNLATK